MRKLLECTIFISRPESDEIPVRITGTVTAGERGLCDSSGAQIDPDFPPEAEVISAVIAKDIPSINEETGEEIKGRYDYRKGQAVTLTAQEEDAAHAALFEAAE